jgi:hypothetical protein
MHITEGEGVSSTEMDTHVRIHRDMKSCCSCRKSILMIGRQYFIKRSIRERRKKGVRVDKAMYDVHIIVSVQV